MTNKEYQIYYAVREYTAINGCAPTVREIGSAVGLKSTATVHHYLNRIMGKGYITYKPNQPRTLRVLK
ncbi:MAG TPA: transcriptional regulator [Syntrophomonas sp.]|jgi:repressor LexA|nr:transcriptional regulator [Syntrophomonas sp.]